MRGVARECLEQPVVGERHDGRLGGKIVMVRAVDRILMRMRMEICSDMF